MTVRTRFAPSPTGNIHIGNARAALFSALYARKFKGVFILRIEDTDVARSELKYVDSLKNDLQWLGVNWQEGLGVEGEYGPYWQSQRADIYLKHYEELVSQNLTYPCFCSEEDLAIERKLQISRSQPPRYRGTCRALTAQEIETRLAQGLKPTLRFRVPQQKAIKFDDLVKGSQSFYSNDIGDFIIRRADGSASFMFSNAVDDGLMLLSHVLRGDDHLANTPRQLMMMQALRLHQPKYGHLALITGDDGTPLSKRHGSYSLGDLRAAGYLPHALTNYLGRLGHSYDSTELLSFDELAQDFNIEKVSRSAARFDLNQLLHWQKLAIAKLDHEALWQWLGADLLQQVPEEAQHVFAETIKANVVFPDEAKIWVKIFFHDKLELKAENLEVIKAAGEQFFVEAELALNAHGTDFKAISQEIKQTLKVSGKQLFMPLRIALTGQHDGPDLASIAALLGQDRMQKRFAAALKLAGSNE